MKSLQDFPDIATPGKNISCIDNELLHPDYAQKYAQDYQRLTNQPIGSPGQLIQSFYTYNQGYRYAGFKSMPNRHRHFARFVETPSIQFITLIRLDIASTVASFIAAMLTGCWRRDGGHQKAVWRFDEDRYGELVAANLHYVLAGLSLIRKMPQTIALTYEDLCQEKYTNTELNCFFGRPIRITKPKPPLHGSAYVANWPRFLDFIRRHADSYDSE